MIKSENELRQARKGIELLERSIEELRADVGVRSDKWFDLMAEGPREELKRLRAEVDEYERRRPAA